MILDANLNMYIEFELGNSQEAFKVGITNEDVTSMRRVRNENLKRAIGVGHMMPGD